MMETPISKVRLVLGWTCNLKCKYCIQRKHDAFYEGSISQACIDYLLGKRDEARFRGDLLKISLLGGEPLLYIKDIETLINRIGDVNVVWKIVTNGTLLNKKNVDYFNQHNVEVVLSHDGKEVKGLRGEDPLTDPTVKQAVMDIRKLSITTVVTSQSQDLIAIERLLQNYLDREFKFIPRFYQLTNRSGDRKFLAYDYEAWEQTCEHILRVALNNSNSWERNFFDEYLGRFYKEYARKKSSSLDEPAAQCLEWGTAVTINKNGEILLCQNRNYVVGQVGAEYAARKANFELVGEIEKKNRKKCDSCFWLSICMRQCPLSKFTDLQEKQCLFLDIFFKKVLIYKERREVEWDKNMRWRLEG